MSFVSSSNFAEQSSAITSADCLATIPGGVSVRTSGDECTLIFTSSSATTVTLPPSVKYLYKYTMIGGGGGGGANRGGGGGGGAYKAGPQNTKLASSDITVTVGAGGAGVASAGANTAHGNAGGASTLTYTSTAGVVNESVPGGGGGGSHVEAFSNSDATEVGGSSPGAGGGGASMNYQTWVPVGGTGLYSGGKSAVTNEINGRFTGGGAGFTMNGFNGYKNGTSETKPSGGNGTSITGPYGTSISISAGGGGADARLASECNDFISVAGNGGTTYMGTTSGGRGESLCGTLQSVDSVAPGYGGGGGGSVTSTSGAGGNGLVFLSYVVGVVTQPIGGTISPAGRFIPGQTYTFTPNSGYTLGSITYKKYFGNDNFKRAVQVEEDLFAANTAVTFTPPSDATDITATFVGSSTAGTNFYYTGAEQTYTVPAGVYAVSFFAQGAGGGGFGYTISNAGGRGGTVTGTLEVTPGQVLKIQVGGNGRARQELGGTERSPGGYNGGGSGSPGASSGGGASDIRSSVGQLSDRLVVAAGGGGSASGFGGSGGSGSRITDADGNFGAVGSPGGNAGTNGVYKGGAGGTLTSGGAGGTGGYGAPNVPEINNGQDGSFGLGGAGALVKASRQASYAAPGGGGGYFGGGGASEGNGDSPSAGGGSSFAAKAAMAQDPTFSTASEVTSGYVAIRPVTHYKLTYKAGTSATGLDRIQPFLSGISRPIYGLSQASAAFSREGHHVVGWNTYIGGNGLPKAFDQGQQLGQDLTLYAQWALDTYTVTYKAGTSGSGSDKTGTFTFGGSLALKDSVAADLAFSRTGYHISGWSTTDDPNASSDYALGYTYSSSSNLILYPVWAVNASAPDSPTQVQAVRGDGQATVNWTTPAGDGGSAITDYTVTSSPGSLTCATTGATSCDVTGLTNGTSYTFTVTATNAAGTSLDSTASASVTPATIPDAPTLATPVSGNGKITVSWQAPASNGGSTITSYTATTTVGGFTCVTSNLTCDITGLTNGTSYTVKVKATNDVGDSTFSGTYTLKAEMLPGAPTITSVVIGDKQVTVYFTAPSPNGGSAITKYYYTTDSGAGIAQVLSTSSPLVVDKTTVTGGALTNGTSYNIQIAAFNSGLGDWSTAQSATPNVLPGSPFAQPTAVAGEGKATVSWMAASDNGGSAILGYTVTSNPGSLTCTTTGSTSCEVTGLTNGVAYTFTVFATNALGNGPASSATGAVKPDVAPGAPTNLALERGDGTLVVSFTAGTNTGSAITKYQYSTNGTTWNNFATNSAATTQTISGLTNGSLYTVYLRAFNTLAGTASSSVSGVPRAAPGAPASFTLTPGFKEISVSWATAIGGGSGMGTTGGSNITKYQYSLNGGAWTDFDDTSSPQVITGLLNAVSYSVKIRAYSDIPGVESSSLSASPIKNSQDPLELTVAETVTWTSSPARTATLTYAVGGSLTLQTTGGSGTGQVVYTKTNDSDCSVVNTTLLIPNVGETCKVTATKVADGDYSSVDSETVWIVTTRANQVPLVWKSQDEVIYGESFDVSYAGGSGTGSITITSQDTSVCTVSGTRVTGVGVGTCTISVAKAISTNFNSAQVTQAVTVGLASQSVTFTSQVPATPLAGDTYNVTATSTSGASPTLTIVSGSCTVSGGVVTFAASGDCVILASASRTNYSNATKTQTISVGQRNQTLSFATAVQNMTSKTYGSPAFFADASTTEATLSPSYALGSATTNSACSVSTSGIVQLLAAGICEIEVSQSGSLAVAAASTISKVFTVLPDQASQPHITSVSAGHQSITAAFIKPSYSGGSPITAYRVDAVYVGGTVSTSACVVAAGDVQTCTISGLTNGTSYQVKVAAITLAGAGIFSDLAASRVPATNPAAVSAFTAVPDNTTINLSWEDPISLGGGTFDSYRVFYKLSSVANYPSGFTTLTRDEDTNAIPTSHIIDRLVNGASYDVKIVTVTTANTASLTSNTAEAKETPRTVPDAPATVDVLEVAGKVVITWSAPQSDGGNPVSEYRVTVNGSACSMANALDTLCEIPVPTTGGTYPIAVQAKNDAGFGSSATATFTKAGVPSSGGITGGGSGGSESAPNGSKAIQILTVSIKSLLSSGGQVVSVTGKNFTGVTTVLVGGVKAKIISVKDGLIKFTAPRNTDGPATLTLKSPTASAEVVDAFTYSKGIAKVKVAWVLGFVQANTTIKAADKAKLRSALLKNVGTVAVTCVGYQSYSYNYPKDAQTAMGRAKQACSYLKSINPKLSVKTVIARTNLTGTPSRKLAVQFKTSK